MVRTRSVPADNDTGSERHAAQPVTLQPVVTLLPPNSPLGTRLSLLAAPRGSAVVRTAWIVPRGENVAHLTTCFVL